MVQNELNSHIELAIKVSQELVTVIEQASNMVLDTLKNGNKILLFGNGGSAGDAQHIAAELTGRFLTERRALPAIALTTDTSAITAIGNDYGFDKIFERQVEALADKGDMLIGISTSGNSKNVVNALEFGREIECLTLGLSGKSGGYMNMACDINIVVPSDSTARIQEMHILIGHIVCATIDTKVNSFD